MKFIEIICLLGHCFRIKDQVREVSFIDDVMERLPPLVVFQVASYLPCGILHFRLLSHSHNTKVIKLYRRVVEEEFHVSLGELAIFSSWNMACVKFVDKMIRIIGRLETEGQISKNSKKYYEGALVSKPSPKNKKYSNSVRVFCDDDTIESSERSFRDLDLINLLQNFIKLYRDRQEIGPLALLLDFLAYSHLKLPRCPMLIVIKVLGYDNFCDNNVKELTNTDWIDHECERFKHNRIKYLNMPDDCELVSWNSVFDDRDEICRSSVKSFYRSDTGEKIQI